MLQTRVVRFVPLREVREPEHVDRRKSIRRAESVPILEALQVWLDTESNTALPKSSLGTAVA